MNYKDPRFYMPIYYFIGTILFFLYFGIKTTQDYIGISITVIGYLIWFIGRINLRNEFYVKPRKPKKLVTTGLYKRISHPLYFSQLIVLIGVLIYANKLYLGLFLIPNFFLQKYRIKKEEIILRKNFGDKFIKHRKQTWF